MAGQFKRSGGMNNLLQQIEELRARMHQAAPGDVLKVSQELDVLIAEYMRSVSHGR